MMRPDFDLPAWPIKLTLAFAAVGVLATIAGAAYGLWRLFA